LPANLAEVDPPVDPSPTETGTAADPNPNRGRGFDVVLGTRDLALRSDTRLRPGRFPENDQDPARVGGSASPRTSRPEPEPVSSPRSRTPGAQPGQRVNLPDGRSSTTGSNGLPGEPVELAQATPRSAVESAGDSVLAALDDRRPGRTLAEIPRVYQVRVAPDRPDRAQQGGASLASELAVERALDWLARHQDRDGRWNGGTARYRDGTPVKGDHDFTVHCPAGETCFGECAYWDTDTALTGLALLTYLGAGYTQTQGRYAETVGKGLDFLIAQQKPDGDLRGPSQIVGMYCHAMATLALCEAYALTGDSRSYAAAERAVAFLVRSRARDGLAWRYAPGAPVGDTSILGWVVMTLKSAKESGIPIPEEVSIRRGTLTWLDQVATGQAKGLARYQVWDRETPTMTAEAWVCRQFLGVGGPSPASTEAAEFLLQHDSDRGETNLYYWYYATLALYQHGGEAWSRWNAKVRDRIVSLQHSSGHQTGSWDPDKSLYGAKGGRIYCTTLAALTLEVYYRYLRLYDDPKIPLDAGSSSPHRSQTEGERPAEPAAPVTNPEDR
jgi:hypothetical protein